MNRVNPNYEVAMRTIYLHSGKFIENSDTPIITALVNAIVSDEPIRLGMLHVSNHADALAGLVMDFIKNPEAVRDDLIKVSTGRRVPKAIEEIEAAQQ